jgi:hypothetical protein
VTCRCLAPARYVGLSRFVSAWPCPVKPFSSQKTKDKEKPGYVHCANHFQGTLLLHAQQEFGSPSISCRVMINELIKKRSSWDAQVHLCMLDCMGSNPTLLIQRQGDRIFAVLVGRWTCLLEPLPVTFVLVWPLLLWEGWCTWMGARPSGCVVASTAMQTTF